MRRHAILAATLPATLAGILAGTLAGTATAQRTWIVGQGGQFSDIQPAIDAASPGDTILVRQGSYGPARSSKGVALLGGPGVVIHRYPPSPDLLTVQSLPLGQTMVIKGFDLTIVNSHRTAAVRLSGNLGKVILEDVSMSAVPFSNAGGYGLEIEGCLQVSINSCSATGEPALLCSASTVNIGRCDLSGQDAFDFRGMYGWHSDHALRATGSRLTIGWSSLAGGSGAVRTFGLWEASPAALLDNCTTVVAGDRSARCIAGTPPPGGRQVAALEVLGGVLAIDPSVTLVAGGGAPKISGNGTVVSARRPALRATGAPPGAALDAELYSMPGAVLILAASAPADWLATPFGDLWLDPAALSALAVSVMGPSEHWQFRAGIPANPTLRGLGVALQAAVGPPSGGVRLSNPVVVVIH